MWKAIKKFMCAFLIVALVATITPVISGTAYNASAAGGTAVSMANYAKSVAGKSKSKLGLSGEWCAAFVYKCAKESGNKSRVGSNAYVGTQARQTVNKKGGTITFVKKSKYKAHKGEFTSTRCKYDKDYKPKAGDLYIQYDSNYDFAHVGVVYKDSTKKDANGRYIAYTLEGNTTCSDGNHTNFKRVEYKKRNDAKFGGGYGICAYVTPKYTNPTHVFYFRDSDDSVVADSKTITEGQNLVPPNATKSGYVLTGWTVLRLKDGKYYHNDGTGWTTSTSNLKVYSPGTSYLINDSWTKGCTGSNYKMIAQWAKVNSHKVIFSPNHDDQPIIGSYNVCENNSFTIPSAIPQRSGYTFLGYYVRRTDYKYFVRYTGWVDTQSVNSKGIATKLYQPGETYNLNDSWWKDNRNCDYVFFAKWIKNNRSDGSHRFTFSANKGEGTYDKTVVYNGGSVTLPSKNPTRSGYKFVGWYVKRSDNKYYKAGTGWVDSNADVKIYPAGSTWTIDDSWRKGYAYGDYCFYAKWQKL